MCEFNLEEEMIHHPVREIVLSAMMEGEGLMARQIPFHKQGSKESF